MASNSHLTKIIIDAEAARIYELAKDMESYPKFMKDVESVTVLEREPGRTVTEWVTSVEDTPIYWKEEDIFDDAAMTIDYRLTEGDLDKFEGRWTFTRNGTGTEVSLSVDYDFGVPMLEELIGPKLDQAVVDNSRMMLEGMKAMIENG